MSSFYCSVKVSSVGGVLELLTKANQRKNFTKKVESTSNPLYVGKIKGKNIRWMFGPKKQFRHQEKKKKKLKK